MEIPLKKLLSQVCRDGKESSHAKPSAVEQCGCSSVVERDLAKVDVESSNLFTRPIFEEKTSSLLGVFFCLTHGESLNE